MSRKKQEIVTQVENMSVFSTADHAKFEEANAIIRDCQLRAEGLAEQIAGQLAIVAAKELYKLEDYKNVHAWAMEVHGIAKGTVSDSINTFKRFGDMETGRLKQQYSAYSFSTLMKMKGLSDEQIKIANITPELSRSQVIDAIKALATLEEKSKEFEAEKQRFEKLYAEWHELVDKPTYEQLKAIAGRCENFFTESVDNRTLDDFVEVNYNLGNAIDAIKHPEDAEVVKETVEELAGEFVPDEEFQPTEEAPFEDKEENNSAVEQEPEAMYININMYRREDGKIDKKALLQELWLMVLATEKDGGEFIVGKYEVPYDYNEKQ